MKEIVIISVQYPMSHANLFFLILSTYENTKIFVLRYRYFRSNRYGNSYSYSCSNINNDTHM